MHRRALTIINYIVHQIYKLNKFSFDENHYAYNKLNTPVFKSAIQYVNIYNNNCKTHSNFTIEFSLNYTKSITKLTNRTFSVSIWSDVNGVLGRRAQIH